MTESLSDNQLIQGIVQRIAFGGNGIIRKDGLVIFVPFTAIGDEVEVRIIKKKKNYAEGQLNKIIHPGSHRVIPLCPYFGHCGGCQLQHLNYAAQLDYKKQSIQDALQRIGNIEIPLPITIVSADPQWHYRRYIQLTLHPFQEGYEMGYIAVDHRSLVPISECVIFLEKDSTLFQQLKELTHKLKRMDSEPARLTVLKNNDNSYILDFHFEKTFPSNAMMVFEKFLTSYSNIKGISIRSTSKKETIGNIEIQFSVDHLNFHLTPGAFVQNHFEQSISIYHSILEELEKAEVKRILDLYCGIGVLTILAAAKGFSMKGIENNPLAIELARANTNSNHVNVPFICANVEKVLEKILNEEKPEAVVINPPRTGIDPKVIKALTLHPMKKLIYVSCMPSTLARDLKELSAIYEIERCTAFDMFPQTAHVETLVVMKPRKR